MIQPQSNKIATWNEAIKLTTETAKQYTTMVTSLQKQHEYIKIEGKPENITSIYENAIREIQSQRKKLTQSMTDKKFELLRPTRKNESKRLKKMATIKAEIKKKQAKLPTVSDQKKRTLESEITNLKKEMKDLKNAIREDRIKETDTLSAFNKKQISHMEKELKKFETNVAGIIAKMQVDVVSSYALHYFKINSTNTEKPNHGNIDKIIAAKIATLSNGGIKALVIRLSACISEADALAVKSYDQALQAMMQTSKSDFQDLENLSIIKEEQSKLFNVFKEGPKPPESHVGLLRKTLQKYKNKSTYQKGIQSIEKDNGIISIGNKYRFAISLSYKKIAKQMKSFVKLNISNAPRKVITKQFQMDENTYTSVHTPANKELDERLQKDGVKSEVFTNLFGDSGVSSMNRKPHINNLYMSELREGEEEIFSIFRHGILYPEKYEKDPITLKQASRAAANELITAAVLKDTADRHLTLEQIQQAEVIDLNFTSVSMVTPDLPRAVANRLLGASNDERRMLSYHMEALHSLESDNLELPVGEKNIPIRPTVSAFNFGVNKLAVGARPLGMEISGLGLDTQYEYNQQAMKSLDSTFNRFITLAKKHDLEDESIKKIQSLKNDIDTLMEDKNAYLRGDNQYEIGGKILLLSNHMDQAIRSINAKNKTTPDFVPLAGHKSAANCMSGKDRTSVMECVGATFAIMTRRLEKTGTFSLPTSAEFKTDPKLQKEFVEILVSLLVKSGNIEITKVNTGKLGFKIKEEARLWGMSLEDLIQIQGLSKLTES